MIRLQNVRKDYIVNNRAVTALKRIDVTIEKGEIFGVIGHSGAGKSTLIRCINLLERPTEGAVIVDGVDLTRLNGRSLQAARREIGMIFQHFNLLNSATIYENVAFPLRLAKARKADVDRKVKELLELVGLSEHAQKYPSQLSGGQKQRVGIARALANEPKVLLCDEATSALDPMTTQSILTLLADINKKLGLTIVLITHEMNVIREICDRVVIIDGGEIAEMGSVLEVFLRPQQKITKEFLQQVSEFEFPQEIRELYSNGNQNENSIKKDNAEKTTSHRVVQVSFLGDLTFQPIMYEVLQSQAVRFNILHGTISRMKGTPFGRLVIELQGNESALTHSVDQLREKGLEVEVML